MKYNELSITKDRRGKRLGRGISAGQGKTAGRGTKGQKSRAGSSKKPGFSGGTNPLMQQLPKLPGFTSHRSKPEQVYTGQLETLSVKTVDSTALAEAGLVSSPYVKIKLLTKGSLTKKLDVKLPAATASAIELIQKAGGTFEVSPQLGRPKQRKSQKS